MKRSAVLWTLTVALTFAASWMLGRVVLSKGTPSTGPGGGRATETASERMEATLHLAKSETDPLSARLRLLELIGGAAPSEFAGLFLSSQTDNSTKLAIAQRWAEVDPGGLYQFLRAVNRNAWEADAVYASACGILFHTWVKTDSAAALAAAKEAGVKPAFRLALRECVQTLMEIDPAKAFAAAEDMPVWARGGDPLNTAELEKNPAVFLAAAGKAGVRALAGNMVQDAIRTVFDAWVKQSPAAAAAWLASTPRTLRVPLWDSLTGSLAGSDTDFTRGWIESLPLSRDRETAGAMLVADWGRKDPQAALAWLQDHLQGGRMEAFEGLARAMMEKGMESAQPLLDSMPPGQARDRVLSSIASTWANKDPGAAAGWVLSLPADDPGRRGALENIGWQWASFDPEAVAAWMLENPDDDALRNQIYQVTNALAKKGLAPALEWALSLKDAGTGRDDAIRSLFQEETGQPRHAEIAAAAEKLTTAQQRVLASEMVNAAVVTIWGDPDRDDRQLRSAGSLPAGPVRDAFQEELAKAKISPERREKITGYLRESAK